MPSADSTTADIRYHAPLPLKRVQEWLQSVTLNSQPIQRYDAPRWLAEIDSEELRALFHQFPDSINRLQLVGLARTASENPTISAALQVFLGTMLWTFNTAAYGPSRVRRILDSGQTFTAALLDALCAVKQGSIARAYTILHQTPVPYFGPAFFTKFLYFTGLGCGTDHYPLILDSRVVQSLTGLLGQNAPIMNELDDYQRYVRLLHEWAELLDCRADSIEYLLSLTPPEFWTL
ncbi:MAG: hypothetical protein JNJ78_08955 [Anaerolineae bacterium]|nr:hypothetical protein [Anaerolineae bacterium]